MVPSLRALDNLQLGLGSAEERVDEVGNWSEVKEVRTGDFIPSGTRDEYDGGKDGSKDKERKSRALFALEIRPEREPACAVHRVTAEEAC